VTDLDAPRTDDHLDEQLRPPTPTPSVVRQGPDRRTLLKAAGLVTLVGGGTAVLAACASTETPTAPASSSAPSSAAASPSAATSSAVPSESASSAAEGPSGPSVAESTVPEASGVILEDADFVVTQPSAGEYKAFSKMCTHQGCAVSEITDTIDCRCHGSKFSITDGSVVNGPATQPLPESKTTTSGGKVYVQA
jgi:Rieske Fe-S protein